MADQATSQPYMEIAEFLEWDDGTDTRYELIEGQVVAMAPARPRHGRMAVRLGSALERRFAAPCAIYSEAGLVHPDDSQNFRVPHLVVSCAPEGPHWVHEPIIVVEVVSPGNERYGMLEKLAFYRSLPSLRQILIVWPERRRVELHVREQDFWAVRTFIGSAALQLVGSAEPVTMDELYSPLSL